MSASEARELCYEHRDAFFRCAASTPSAAAAAATPATAAASTPSAAAAAATPATAAAATPAAAAAACGPERARFEAACPRAWVRYWDERVKRGQPLKTPGS
jgi:hypothetical protein